MGDGRDTDVEEGEDDAVEDDEDEDGPPVSSTIA